VTATDERAGARAPRQKLRHALLVPLRARPPREAPAQLSQKNQEEMGEEHQRSETSIQKISLKI